MNRTRHAALLAALVLDLGMPGEARADDAPHDETAADALFREGRKLLEDGHCEEAIPRFEASQRLDPGVGTLLNLAFCNEQLGKTATAWRGYLDAAAAARAIGEDERERIARSRAAALEPNIPRLTVSIAAPTPELAVEVDGVAVPRASLGSPMPVDPGPHKVEARIAMRPAWSTNVQVDPRHQSVVLVPALEPAAPPAHADLPVTTSGDKWRTPAIVTLAATGVIGLGLDAAFVVAAKARYDGSQDPSVCTSENHCTAQGQQMRNAVHTYGDVATVAGITGGALLAGAAVLWLTAPKASHRPATAVAVDPEVGPRTWGVTVTSSW